MKKRIIFAILILIALIVVGAYGTYLTSSAQLKVTFKNIESISIVETSNNNQTIVSQVSTSPFTIRLSKEQTYDVTYTGAEGYASGSKTVDVGGGSISIDPDYSKQHYQSLMTDALPQASAILQTKYSSLDSLYSIRSVAMRDKGSWYVVELVHTGEYSENSDTLRALFHKNGDAWELVSSPDILLTTRDYPSIDSAILSWANSAP